jgi:hypothetical protein
MDFELTDRCEALVERLEEFVEERVYPAERVWRSGYPEPLTSTRRSWRS